MSVEIRPGLAAEREFAVGDHDTAARLGSGDLDVLGTPRLLAWMEATTCAVLTDHLDEGTTSVGTRVQVDHLRASPVGERLTVNAAVRYVDGRLLRFEVTATDTAGVVVGHGEVTRVVVDRARYLSRL